MQNTDVKPLSIFQDFNGYVAIARPALRLRAQDVQVGDVLLLDGYVTRVDEIDREKTPCGCDVFHFKGALNVFRGWHETVSVIRPTEQEQA